MSDQLTDLYAAELGLCFDQLAEELYRSAYFWTRGRRELAEDLVQDAFRAAADRWTTLRPLDSDQRLAWLRTVARRRYVDHLRREGVARDHQREVYERYGTTEHDTYREAMSSIAVSRVWREIKSMPPQRALIAVMWWRDGMKGSEIAVELGIRPGTVRTHIFLARTQLCGALRDYVGEDEPGHRRAREVSDD